MPLYLIFIRAINVGGNNIVKMKDFCESLTKLGFQNIRSYIQSGNIILESNLDLKDIEQKICAVLKKTTEKDIEIFLLSSDEFKKIIELNPFKNIEKSDEIKMYVTFTKAVDLCLHKDDKEGDAEIIEIKYNAIFSTVSKNAKHADLDKLIKSIYKGSTTTRNWNVIEKIAEIIEQ